MDGRVGDRIIVEAPTSSTTKRSGLIEEVLAGERPRYVVGWEDGHTSIFSPSAGSARIVAARARKRTTSKSGASSPKKKGRASSKSGASSKGRASSPKKRA